MAHRILYITHYADMYGANRSLLDLMVSLKKGGEVLPHVVLPEEGPMVDELQEHQIPWKAIPFVQWMARRVFMGGTHHRLMQWLGYRRDAADRRMRNEQALPDVLAAMRVWGTGLIHSNSSVIGIGHLAAQASGIPLVWHFRELPFKHYGFHPDQGVRGFRHNVDRAGRVIAISRAVHDEIRPWTTDPDKIVTIHNGIIADDRMRMLRTMGKAFRPSDATFTFALIGYFHRSKGQIEALEAFAEIANGHDDVELLIAGSGDATAINERIDRLKIADRVRLMGFVSDPSTVLSKADALLMCSRHEALGRVTVEAMAHGLPVIGHDSGGTPELIVDGVNGYLYKEHETLVRRMRTLVEDRTAAHRMGNAAQDMLGDRFSIEARSRDVLKVYEDLLGE
jgi:glycosyltransferase involved in cell wall biosynthesis